MSDKKILVTGSAGFIGFHAAQALKKRGDFVIGCDHFNNYYDPSLKRARASLLEQQGIETIDVDICHMPTITALIEKHEITHLLHLAAQAGVRYSLQHPESYIHSNLNGFIQILETLKQFSHIKLIYASSSSVYGLNAKIPFSETDRTDQPTNLYGATKKSNEITAHAYHHLFGIASTGLRFFTVYGPWGRPDMAYFSFTKSILEGTPLSIYGKGMLQRDFTYIDDIVRGILAAIDLGAPCEIFNLGNHKPEKILDMVGILEELLGKKALIAFEPMPPGDMPVTYADISKSQQQLGFQPTVDLREGLKRFTDWYQRYFSKSDHLVQLSH
jgi:UDP-glucuronate 4-epimerase